LRIRITEDFAHLVDDAHPHYKTRYLVWYGGRGSGKTVNVAKGLLVRGKKDKITVLCVREFQNSISDSVIKTLADEIENLGFSDFYEVQSNGIYGKNGTEFIFKGVRNNVQSIKSMANLDYIWAEEAQVISDGSWETLIPTLRQPGSQFFITLNPRNPTDPTYVRFISEKSSDTYALRVNFNRNPWFPDALKKEAEKLQKTDPEAYSHIYLGEFDTRRSGAVYAKQIAKAREDGRITLVPYDPSCQVFTSWDLGFGDSTAIWWLQFVGRELRWIDFYENNGEMLDHYAGIVKAKPYNYFRRGHYLPHDGGHGNIRGESVSRQLEMLGIQNEVLARESDINPGIEVLRQTLAYSVFDAQKCKDGLHALENYGYEWDDDKGAFKGKPVHNWSSHAADSARYAAIAAGFIKTGIQVKPPDPFHTGGQRSWMG